MIRSITIEEVHKFAELGRWFFANIIKEDDFSVDGFCQTWQTLIEREAGFILARFNDAEPQEAIGVAQYRDGQSKGLVARTMFWFYLQESSGLEAGTLHRALEFDCRNRGIKTLWIGAKCNDRLDRVGGFLLKSGYQLDEMLYKKSL